MSDVMEALPAHKSAARLKAVQALYQMDMGYASVRKEGLEWAKQKLDVPIDNESNVVPFDKELYGLIVQAVVDREGDIDGLLQGSLDEKWPLARLEKTLKCILRAGTAELISHASIDAGIIINDYVNVAHEFFAGKEPLLVNAVLDKIAKNVRS